jgi:DNA-binding NtrC family response regulator
MNEGKMRILFIDDEDIVLTALQRVLRNEPYEVHFTNDPESAFRLVSEHRIDVVFCDHSMPNMTGIEFLSLLRRLHANVIRVMMTGQTDRTTSVSAINEGRVHRFIEKPWVNEQLLGTLRELDREVQLGRRTASAGTGDRALKSLLKDTTGAIVIGSDDEG